MVVVVADVVTGVVVVVVVLDLVVLLVVVVLDVVVLLVVDLVFVAGLGIAATEVIQARAMRAPVVKCMMMNGGWAKRIHYSTDLYSVPVFKEAKIPKVVHCNFLYIGAVVAS